VPLLDHGVTLSPSVEFRDRCGQHRLRLIRALVSVDTAMTCPERSAMSHAVGNMSYWRSSVSRPRVDTGHCSKGGEKSAASAGLRLGLDWEGLGKEAWLLKSETAPPDVRGRPARK
jgi:hypothetical protein